MRLLGAVTCGLLLLSFGQGCEQHIPKDELGNVIFELPNVPGADKPPPTPELDNTNSNAGSKNEHVGGG